MQRRRMVTTAAAGLLGIAAGTQAGGGPATGGGPAAAHEAPVRLDQLRLVNLSHVNDPETTSIFPGDPPFRLTTIATVPEDGFYMQYVEEGEHTGTHWGAPCHFDEDGLCADQLDPNDLFLPAVKIDIRRQAAADADYAVTVEDLRRWERRHGRIPSGAAVILWTGWEDKWGTPAYPNLDAEGVIHQPGFGIEAVRWLVDTGRLGRRGSLGTDTFSPDRGIDSAFEVSVLLYRRHRISLENLNNLAKLPGTGAWVLVGGPIHRRGSGSTATIYAVIPPGR
ncbi:MAG TPA: cyclase family protein [Pilimelia sp.]|nr:cyclase family protein [Pilimelia sp.]